MYYHGHAVHTSSKLGENVHNTYHDKNICGEFRTLSPIDSTCETCVEYSNTYFSPGFPIQSGNDRAFCCNMDINTPRLITGLG